MEKLLKLVDKGALITRVVTVALTGVCVYLWVIGRPLDETLRSSWLIILGFWFNSELTKQIITELLKKVK